jgi:hypothetical protein
MRKISFVLMLLAHLCLDAQTSTLDDINKTAENALKVLKLFKKDEPSTDESPPADHEFKSTKLMTEGSSKPKSKQKTQRYCKEFCIENLHKKNSKIELFSKETEDKQTLQVMARDKSCVFDIPQGVYQLRVYQDDKLVKKTDYRIDDDEQETFTIPE